MKFSGGKHLTKFRELVHHAMIKNELGNEENAYKLSYARIGNSGYSFGLNQMDLKTYGKARLILRDILVEARNEKTIIITDQEINEVIDHVHKYSPNEKDLKQNYKDKVNTALASSNSRLRLERVYVQEINDKTNFINNKIIPQVHSHYRNSVTDHVKVLLVDYHNQFDIEIDGSMYEFLKGNEVIIGSPTKSCPNSKPKKEQLNLSQPLLGQLTEFIKNTCYGQTYPDDIKRRQQNIEDVIKNQKPIPTDPKDTQVADELIKNYNGDPTIVPAEERAALSSAIKDVEKRYIEDSKKIGIEIDGSKEEAKNKQNALTLEHLRQVFSFINDVADFTNNNTLGKIGGFGTHAINVFQKIKDLSNVTFSVASIGSVLAWAQPAGAAVGAAFALFQLIKGGSNNEQNQMYDLINDLKNYIQQQFEQVFASLEIIFTTINELRESIITDFQIPTLEALNRIEIKIDNLTLYVREGLTNIYIKELKDHLLMVREYPLRTNLDKMIAAQKFYTYITQSLYERFLTNQLIMNTTFPQEDGDYENLEQELIVLRIFDRLFKFNGDDNKLIAHDDNFDMVSEDTGGYIRALSFYEKGLFDRFALWKIPHFALWHANITALITVLLGMSGEEIDYLGYVSKLNTVKDMCNNQLTDIYKQIQVNKKLVSKLFERYSYYLDLLEKLRLFGLLLYLSKQVDFSSKHELNLDRTLTFAEIVASNLEQDRKKILDRLLLYKNLLIIFAKFARISEKCKSEINKLIATSNIFETLPLDKSIVFVDSKYFNEHTTAKLPFYISTQSCRMNIISESKATQKVAVAFIDDNKIKINLFNLEENKWEINPEFPRGAWKNDASDTRGQENPYPSLETFTILPVAQQDGSDLLYFAHIDRKGLWTHVISIKRYNIDNKSDLNLAWQEWILPVTAGSVPDPLHITKEKQYTRSWRFILGEIDQHPCIISVAIMNNGLWIAYFDTITKEWNENFPEKKIKIGQPNFGGKTGGLHVNDSYFETLRIFFVHGNLYIFARNHQYVQGCVFNFHNQQFFDLPPGPIWSSAQEYSADRYFKTIKGILLNQQIHLLIKNKLGIELHRLNRVNDTDYKWEELFNLWSSNPRKQGSPSWSDEDVFRYTLGDSWLKQGLKLCIDAKAVKINGDDWLALGFHKVNSICLYLYNPKAENQEFSWMSIQVPYKMPPHVWGSISQNKVIISLSAVKNNYKKDDLFVLILVHNDRNKLVDSFYFIQKLSIKPIPTLGNLPKSVADVIDELFNYPGERRHMPDRPMCQIEYSLFTQRDILNITIPKILHQPSFSGENRSDAGLMATFGLHSGISRLSYDSIINPVEHKLAVNNNVMPIRPDN